MLDIKVGRWRKSLQALQATVQTPGSPYASGIIAPVAILLESVLKSKDYSETMQTLVERVLEVSAACIPIVSQEGTTLDPKLLHCINQLIIELERIAEITSAQAERGRVTRYLRKSADTSILKEILERLEHCVTVLSMQMQLDNLRISAHIVSEAPKQNIEVQRALETTQKELIKELSPHMNIQKGCLRLPGRPQIFHGRHEIVETVVKMITQGQSSRACILGPGGVGKTSISLAVAHHLSAAKHFTDYRFFVPCDALQDADEIVAFISNAFRIEPKQFWNQFSHMCGILKAKMLFLFDNIETPWEPWATRRGVEVFLSKLSDIPNVSFIITLRGSERPRDVLWTRPFLSPIEPLDFESAKATFLDISDVEENTPGVDDLIFAVDMLPLAITLLANRAQHTSCITLINIWNQQKTAIVTRGINDRYSSLDVSIEVSCSSPRLEQEPLAFSVLQILSILPDGIYTSDLTQMLVGSIDDAKHVASVLVQVGLAYRPDAERVRCLAPVREYVQIRQPFGDDLFRGVFEFYETLALSLETSDWQLRISTENLLRKHLGNFNSTLAYSLGMPTFQSRGIAAIVTRHSQDPQVRIDPSPALLTKCLALARLLHNPILEADCICAIARHQESDGSDCIPSLEHAIQIYESSLPVDVQRLCKALHYYGRINLNINKPLQTRSTAERIISLLEANILSWNGQADFLALTYALLAQAHTFSGKPQEGVSTVVKGLLITGVSPMFQARLLHARAECYSVQGLLPSAADDGLKLVQLYDSIGPDEHNQARYHSLTTIGEIYLMQSRGEIAEAIIAEGLLWQLKYQPWNTQRLALSYWYAGRIASLRGQDITASEYLKLAYSLLSQQLQRQESQQHGSMSKRIECFILCTFAEVDMRSSDYQAALVRLRAAHSIHRGSRDGDYNEIRILLLWSDWYSSDGAGQSRRQSALNSAILVALISRKWGDRLALSMALQRIGDFFYGDEDTLPTANACYEAELELIRYLGVRRHLGDCLLRLGMVGLRERRVEDAGPKLRTAKRFYIDGEDQSNVEICEGVLEFVARRDWEINELPALPRGNTLF